MKQRRAKHRSFRSSVQRERWRGTTSTWCCLALPGFRQTSGPSVVKASRNIEFGVTISRNNANKVTNWNMPSILGTFMQRGRFRLTFKLWILVLLVITSSSNLSLFFSKSRLHYPTAEKANVIKLSRDFWGKISWIKLLHVLRTNPLKRDGIVSVEI